MDGIEEKSEKKVAKLNTAGLPDLPEKPVPPVLPVKMLALDCLQEAEWNVTEDSAKSLDLLTENIRQIGFVENLVVMPLGDDKYRIISGHDKSRAARAAGLTEVPCTILPEDASLDMQKLLTVRMNVIKKKMNPVKFVRVFQEIAAKYSEEIAKSMMMFTDSQEMEGMISKVRKAMPDAMKKELDAKKTEIKSVDDLASIVAEIFNRAGSQLDRGFAIFSFGGQEHFYFSMDKSLRARMAGIIDKSELENRHVSEILKEELGVAT